MKEKAKGILRDLYERVVNNWESTLTGALIIIGLIEWRRGDISTEEFGTFVSVVAAIVALFHKRK